MRGNSKLDFSRLQIRGRSAELSTLMRAYEKCSCSSGEVAFVSGPRGSGKSMLIRSFLDRVRTDSPLTLCATAKFVKTQHDFKGFSAITEAINGLCEQILENNEFLVSLRPLIIDALGSEIDVLGRIVPFILGKLVPDRNPAQNDPNRVMGGTDKNDEEWNNDARILQCLQVRMYHIVKMTSDVVLDGFSTNW
jgi:energy-coupling factor transporter ATP-binding protein EcfA2